MPSTVLIYNIYFSVLCVVHSNSLEISSFTQATGQMSVKTTKLSVSLLHFHLGMAVAITKVSQSPKSYRSIFIDTY